MKKASILISPKWSLLALVIAIPGLGRADTSYIGPDGGSWSDAANWNNGLPASASGWAEVKSGGTVVIDSATNASSASLYLGNNSTVSQTGGDYTTAGGFEFGIGDGGVGTGTYNLSGGTLNIGNDFLIVGNSAGSTGFLNVTGTGVVNTNGHGLILGRDNPTAVGFLTIENGGQVNASGISVFGAPGSAGVGTINLNTGGLLSVSQNIGPDQGSMTLAFNGGTLKVGGVGDFGGFVQAGVVTTLGANGGIVDTSGQDTGVQSSMSGVGGLTILGGSQLKSSGTQTFHGNVNVASVGGQFTIEGAGSMTFYIGADGINNKITGVGNFLAFGSFNFDLSSAAPAGSWTIVDTANKTFDTGFSVTGWTDAGNDTWTSGNYTFDEATGVLTAVPEPATLVLITGGLAGIMIFRRRRSVRA